MAAWQAYFCIDPKRRERLLVVLVLPIIRGYFELPGPVKFLCTFMRHTRLHMPVRHFGKFGDNLHLQSPKQHIMRVGEHLVPRGLNPSKIMIRNAS